MKSDVPLPVRVITREEYPDISERRAVLIAQRRAFDDVVRELPGDQDTLFNWKLRIILKLFRWSLRATGLWERGRRNAQRPNLHRLEWEHPSLPAELDGLSILHITDLHYRNDDPEFAQWVEGLVQGMDVDLCLMTGDFRFGHVGDWGHIREKLSRLLGCFNARHGAFTTLGNHDLMDHAPALESVGIRVLEQEGVEVVINGARVWIGGTDDSHVVKCGDVEVAMEGATEEHFKILLSHTPELALEAAAAGFHMYLCGHTHGGQVCLPWWGPVEHNAHCERRFLHGPWREGNLLGLTSAGAGATDLPVRFNCPGEIHVITLGCGR